MVEIKKCKIDFLKYGKYKKKKLLLKIVLTRGGGGAGKRV